MLMQDILEKATAARKVHAQDPALMVCRPTSLSRSNRLPRPSLRHPPRSPSVAPPPPVPPTLAPLRSQVGRDRLALYAALRVAAAAMHGHVPSGRATPRLLLAWRRLWAYEAANPQRLDPPRQLARMRFALAQGVGALWRAPQLWHEAASWFESKYQ